MKSDEQVDVKIINSLATDAKPLLKKSNGDRQMELENISTDWHREDILAAVRKKKKSLSALSRESGLSSGTLGNALNKPWPRGENIIASIIGVPPEEIWPSRYQQKKFKPRPLQEPAVLDD